MICNQHFVQCIQILTITKKLPNRFDSSCVNRQSSQKFLVFVFQPNGNYQNLKTSIRIDQNSNVIFANIVALPTGFSQNTSRQSSSIQNYTSTHTRKEHFGLEFTCIYVYYRAKKHIFKSVVLDDKSNLKRAPDPSCVLQQELCVISYSFLVLHLHRINF